MKNEIKTKRYCLALDLNDDPELIAEYIHYHKPENAWTEITENMAQSGIIDMEIYHVADRLFMIMETTLGFDPSNVKLSPSGQQANDKWEALMWKYQKPIKGAKAGEKWIAMEKIYDLKNAI